VAVYNHYKRVNMMASGEADIELQKSNILMLARRVRQDAARPDAGAHPERAGSRSRRHRLTEAGYVGEDVENICSSSSRRGLRRQEGRDRDHLHRRGGQDRAQGGHPSITRDVPARACSSAAQDPRGTVASVPPQGGRKHPHQEFLTIDTTNILFICGGAFANLDKIIERRIGHKGVGFAADVTSRNQRDSHDLYSKVLPEDLMNYGLIPSSSAPAGDLVRPPADARRPGQDPDRAEERDGQAVQGASRLRRVELVFAEDSPRRRRRPRARARDRRPRPALHPRGRAPDVMFDLPSRDDVRKCVITRDTLERSCRDPGHRGGRPPLDPRGSRIRVGGAGSAR